jgi:hypothetical protein
VIDVKPLPFAGAVTCSLLCITNAVNSQVALAATGSVLAGLWVYLAIGSPVSPNFKQGGKK